MSTVHFPVQQRSDQGRHGLGLNDDRPSVLWLCALAMVSSAGYAATALVTGTMPRVSWVVCAITFTCATAAMAMAARSATRVAVLLLVLGLWLSGVALLLGAGRMAPSGTLFTLSVVLSALAAGRRAAMPVLAASLTVTLSLWWWMPTGLEPDAAAALSLRRPIADLEMFLFGSFIAVWWSWRTERAARAHAELAGNAQILETLREAVASSRSGICIANVEGQVTYLNQAILDMWRIEDAGEAIGKGVDEFWADQEAAREALWRLARGEDTVTLLRAKRSDGSEFDVELSGSRIVGEGGVIDGYIGSFIDVTGRSVAERRLLTERERTRAIVESVLDIVVILDEQGTIIFENSAVQRVLGYDPGERVGQPILSYAHPDDLERAAASMGSLFTDTDSLARVTMRFRHKSGGWRWLETFGRNMIHVPAIGGILGVGRDVTEQRELQARVDASERLETVGRLAGGVAHDFNNLLTAILGNTELAKLRSPSDEEMHRYLDGVMQAGERARDLTRKLLAFARREITQPIVIDVRHRLMDAQSLLRRILGADIELRVDAGSVPLPVLMDPVHFEQIILNLAVNARDAMPSGGRFTIRGSVTQVADVESSFLGKIAPGPAVRLVISDSGQGMAPEVAARVFEPFFTTKELGRGTGLGLSTVYGSVAQAGGVIRVISAVGAGTTFEVLLPITTAAPDAPAQPATPTRTPLQLVVLVAEDDDSVRGFMVEVLTKAGCRVLEAVDGQDGTSVVDAFADNIDLLVTDVVMPNRNGLELAAHFTTVRPDGRVLFVTGYSTDPTIEEQAEALGALVLLKPFTVEQLLTHVSRLAR